MLYNATILRIDSPSAPDAGGNATLTAGAAMSCRCLVTEPTQRDVYALGAASGGAGKTLDGSQVLSVVIEELVAAYARAGYPSGLLLAEGKKLVAKDDLGVTTSYSVRKVVSQPHGSRSMVVAELRRD